MAILNELNKESRWEEVEKIEGNLLYLKGHSYPHKGIPTVQKLEKANEIKKAIRHFHVIRHIPLLYHQLSPFAAEMLELITHFVHRQTAHRIAFVLEYDQAYRFRLQDLFNETTKEKLQNPLEILRLLRINKQRDQKGVHRKLRPLFVLLFLYALTHPRRWRNAIQQANFTLLQPDDNDLYWMKLKSDYKYGNS